MARTATLKVQILTDHDSRGMDSAGRGLDKLAGLAKAAAAAIGVALVALGKKAFDEASKLEQALGAVESVFGQAADTVKTKAAEAADAVGLSTSSYAEMAALLGAQMKNMGIAVDELSPKTDELINIGADIAATFGGTTADAVAALSSLLRGERDPIERYGVSIKQADIEARKAELGLKGLSGEAERNADLQATLSLLTEQTADAQGQFARESDTAAGAAQRMSAHWDNFTAQIGQWLLPAFVAITTWITNSVIPALRDLATWLGDNVGPVITQVADWISENLWPALQELWALLVDSVGPILSTVGGIILDVVIPAVSGFWSFVAEKLWPILRDSLGPVLVTIRDGFQDVAGKVQGLWDKVHPLVGKISELYGWLYDKLAPILGGTLMVGFQLAAGAAGLLLDSLGWLIDKAIQAYDSIQSLISALKALDGTKVSYQILKGTDVSGKLGGEYGFVYDAAGPSTRSVRDLTAAATSYGGAGAAVYPKIGAPQVDVYVSVGDGPVRRIAADEYRVQTGRAARRVLQPATGGLA